MPRRLHATTTAATIPAAVLGPDLVLRRSGRVRGSGLGWGSLGAAREQQDDEEHDEPSAPLHRLLQGAGSGEPISHKRHPVATKAVWPVAFPGPNG